MNEVRINVRAEDAQKEFLDRPGDKRVRLGLPVTEERESAQWKNSGRTTRRAPAAALSYELACPADISRAVRLLEDRQNFALLESGGSEAANLNGK
jgi:hypothetical protein